MKKLLLVVVLVALAYGAYRYLQGVQEKTAERQDLLRPSEKALKEMDKESAAK